MKRALLSVFLVAFSAGFIELASRAIHFGKSPLLPYYFERGAALLPSGMDLKASFYGLPENRYVTDAWGARISDPALASSRPGKGMFVVGDSQVLGYMLDFDDTFASKVAKAALGGPQHARILASPANHPETYSTALEEYAPQGLERQRLAVVGLNLGNDLDEMYSEALNWSRDSSPPLSRWLLTHSFLYMDWVLFKSHVLQPGEEPLGINRIFYMLAPDERVILARETVRTLDTALRKLPADQVMVLIIPADIQLDPKEFLKYRRYYHCDDEFEPWNAAAGEVGAVMNSLETYIAGQLERKGYRVLRLSQLAAGQNSKSDPLFDKTSHHITARTHGLIANAILAEMGRP